jgi:Tol biopolymer transport system component
MVRAADTEPQLGWEPFLRPGLIVGRFELLREIARGGFGVVYEARDCELGRTVAFKALRSSLRPKALEERLLFEAEAAARCSHPNIVTLFDFGRTELGPYLVLELLHGETLAARLHRGPIPREEALRIAIEISRGLAHAHSQEVIHRDLTPGNVFLCSDGQVKLLDLGMAHAFGRPVLEGGTPGYMAPEQCNGAPQDARTDVYALGAVLLRMLGVQCVAGDGAGAALQLRGGSANGALQALVTRMLHPDPAARPQNAGAVLAAFTEIDRAAAASRSRAEAAPRRGRAATILVAVTLTAFAGWILVSRARPEENPLARARFVQLTDFEGTEQAAAISRDGRWVAFQSARDKQMDIWVTEVGTGRFTNLTRGSASGIVNPSLRALAFSPDGSAVTFWARGPGAGNGPEISVWAAPLSGERVRPYLEGAAEYDWTPDGTRLVYHTPGPGDPMYVRDAADTSSGRQIFSAPEGLHGHFLLWSPDRAFIYFVQGSPPEHLDIWRLPSDGGTAERLTFHDSAVTHPVFLDSRTLLYLAQDEDGAGPWIYALNVENRTSRRVSSGIETYTSLAASGDGRRLVATMAGPKGTLWRVPFDGLNIDMSSAERIPLTTGDGSLPRLGPGYLLYVSSRGTSDTLWKLSAGVATELWSAPGERIVGAPTSRRDGSRIAFTTRHHGETKLYVVNLDGTDAQILSRGLAPRGAPAWTPDGQAITIASLVDGAPRLFTVPVDGGAATPFVTEQSIDPVWSPRSDVVAFSGADVGTMFPVKAVRADGRGHGIASLRLTRGARHFAFMPDGRSLVLMRGEIGHNNLWVVDLETGAERKVSEFKPDFTVKDFDLSPDGREIVLHQVHQQSDIVLLELPSS